MRFGFRIPGARWMFAAALLLFWLPWTWESAFGALPSEPDWRARFDYWTGRMQSRFVEPVLPMDWSGALKSGVTVTGVLQRISEEAIEVADGLHEFRYERVALSREDRMKLFREDFARGGALQQVLEEKQAYRLQDNPLLPAHLITKFRLLTTVQFSEYGREKENFLLLQEGWVQDVRLDYFGGAQAVISLTPPEQTNLAVVCVFPVNGEDAQSLKKGAVVRFFGSVRSVRAYPGIIRLTLRDVSLDGMESPVAQSETGEEQP